MIAAHHGKTWLTDAINEDFAAILYDKEIIFILCEKRIKKRNNERNIARQMHELPYMDLSDWSEYGSEYTSNKVLSFYFMFQNP